MQPATHSLSPASSLLVILCHLLPSSFSALCLHSVCASTEFPSSLWGELRFSLLRSSLVLLLYVSHAGTSFLFLHAAGSVLRLRLSHKGPYSVMLQSPHPQGSSLDLPLSPRLLFSLFFYKTFMPLFSFPPLSTLSPSPSLTFLICLSDSSTSDTFHLIHALSLPSPNDTGKLEMTPFSCLVFCFPVFFFLVEWQVSLRIAGCQKTKREGIKHQNDHLPGMLFQFYRP